MVTNGGKQAIYNLFQIILNPGDEVLIPSPYWLSYPEIALLAGAKPKILSSLPEEGFAIGEIPKSSIELNPSELALLQRLLQEKLPFHSNGKLLGPKNVWLKLLKIVEAWIETNLQKRITSLQMMREVIISNDLINN